MPLISESNKTRGVIAILGASIMWAIEPILAKISFESTDFWNTFATRIFFCLLVIVLFLLFTRQSIRVKRHFIPVLVYVSFASTLAGDLIYIYALTRVPVVNAVILGHMQPIFVVVFGYIVLKQDRITFFDYCGIACMIIAGVLVTTKTLSNLQTLKIGTIGDFYVLIAMVSWATTAIAARKFLRDIPAGVIAFYRFLIAGAAYFIFMVIARSIRITSVYQVVLGCVIGIGTILYYQGIQRIKAAQVSALELSTPLFSTLLAYFFLREVPTSMQITGIMLVVGGIFFLSKKE
jgi:drug/metabolite transporter (DMT)-like permease